jgi:FMN phosphatase YigB (HAD superfamily)
VVALDFDGVLCDSIDECMWVSYMAYREMQGVGAETAELNPDFINAFRRMRYLVRPAREYWALVHYLVSPDVERRGDINQPEFDAFARRYADSLAAYEPRFFAERRRMQRDQPERWLALHRPYKEAMSGLRLLSERYPVHVVTTKDRWSVERLADAWNLGLPSSRFWTHDTGMSKPECVLRIATEASAVVHAVHFVDDHFSHLHEVAATGAKCYWATWGYTPQLAGTAACGVEALESLVQLADILEVT